MKNDARCSADKMEPAEEHNRNFRGASQSKRVVVVMGSDITPEPVTWLWPDFLALGKLHIIAGRPGSLKTTMAMDWAATVTNGALWPDGTRAPKGRVVVWSGEDAPKDTLMPRFLAAGGDPKEIFFISAVKEGLKKRAFDPSQDMGEVATLCAQLGNVELIIIDPVVSITKGDSHKNAEARRDLQPLVDLAERTNAVILGVHHLTKGTEKSDPLDRVSGSLAYGAAPRLVLLSAIDPKQTKPHGVLMRVKNSNGPSRGGYNFKAEARRLDNYPEISTQRILWGDYVNESTREVLARLEGPETGMRQSAVFLREALKDGPRSAREVIARGRAAGLNERSLRRALATLSGTSEKAGFGGGWLWDLPGQAS